MEIYMSEAFWSYTYQTFAIELLDANRHELVQELRAMRIFGQLTCVLIRHGHEQRCEPYIICHRNLLLIEKYEALMRATLAGLFAKERELLALPVPLGSVPEAFWGPRNAEEGGW
jgi:hypothetical protein